MRFQGETCTLSFGLFFDQDQVLLNGSLWPRRPAAFEPRQQPPRLRFNNRFSAADISRLQDWLLSGSAEPLDLPDPMRRIRRIPLPDNETADDLIGLEIELRTPEVPTWWAWDVEFPLKLRIIIRASEYTYLTNALSREHWSSNLTW